jgi:hypothetical protein
MPLDLDAVQQIINRPHIVDLRDNGFTLMHPPACHPRLFECEYNRVSRNNLQDPGKRGQYLCALVRKAGGDPLFVIGDPAPESEGVPWNALVAELRAARHFDQEAFEVITDLLDWMKRRQQGDPKLHPEEYFRLTEWAQRLLDDYDQVTGEASDGR